jgi:hypothetical protein
MTPRTEIINNRIVNSVEQLASFLRPGDIFRQLRGKTQYKFSELRLTEKLVFCENLDTHIMEHIYFNSPVFKLVFI